MGVAESYPSSASPVLCSPGTGPNDIVSPSSPAIVWPCSKGAGAVIPLSGALLLASTSQQPVDRFPLETGHDVCPHADSLKPFSQLLCHPVGCLYLGALDPRRQAAGKIEFSLLCILANTWC